MLLEPALYSYIKTGLVKRQCQFSQKLQVESVYEGCRWGDICGIPASTGSYIPR